MAAGSFEDLGKSEHEREAARKQLHREIGTEHTHTMGRDSTHGCTTRDRCSVALKRGRSIDTGVSGERPRPKEQWAERGRSRKCRYKDSPECPPPPQFLFTPTAPSRPITGSLHAPSLDSNRGSLPLDRGVDAEVPVSSAGLITPSSACQLVQSSGQLANAQVDSIFVTSRLTAEQYEEIFLLSREVQTLLGKLALEFIELPHEEARYHMGAQATSHEKAIQVRPDCSTGKCDEATRCSGEVTWLETNSLLFCHTIEYQNNMIQLITRSQEAIQALHERIWKVVRWVMESAGKSAVDGLEIALRLVDMLLSVPLQLTFNTVTAKLPGFTPEALTYTSLLSTNQGAMTVLGEERLKGARGAEEKVMQATWCVTVTDEGLVKVTTIGSEGGDDPNHPDASLSPAVHASTFSDWHATGYQTPHSPSRSPSHSPSRNHHSWGPRPRPHTSNSSVEFWQLEPN